MKVCATKTRTLKALVAVLMVSIAFTSCGGRVREVQGTETKTSLPSVRPEGCVDFMILQNAWTDRESVLEMVRKVTSEKFPSSVTPGFEAATERDSWSDVLEKMVFDSATLSTLAADLYQLIAVRIRLLNFTASDLDAGNDVSTQLVEADINLTDIKRAFKSLSQSMAGC
jgi:hypothetical protein